MLNVDAGTVIGAHALLVTLSRKGDVLIRVRINNYRPIHIQPIVRRDNVFVHDSMVNFRCYVVRAKIKRGIRGVSSLFVGSNHS